MRCQICPLSVEKRPSDNFRIRAIRRGAYIRTYIRITTAGKQCGGGHNNTGNLPTHCRQSGQGGHAIVSVIKKWRGYRATKYSVYIRTGGFLIVNNDRKPRGKPLHGADGRRTSPRGRLLFGRKGLRVQ